MRIGATRTEFRIRKTVLPDVPSELSGMILFSFIRFAKLLPELHLGRAKGEGQTVTPPSERKRFHAINGGLIAKESFPRA